MSKTKKSNKFLLLLYSHPRIAVAAALIIINLIIVLIFTSILALIRQSAFLDELAYCFIFTMSSDGLYDFMDDKDVICLVLKIVLALIQMIIFSGALIGFTTDILSSLFDRQMENRGKLHLKNHYVILNWSSIGPNIVYELSFFEGEKTVVILCENEREQVINSIDSIFTINHKKKKGIRIFVKKGDPNSPKHLSDISIDNAKCIGILLTEKEDTLSEEKGISTKDLHSFKLLMSIISVSKSCSIVMETENSSAVEKIEKLIKLTNPEIAKRISLFSHNSIIGHILGRAVTNPLFSVLYHEIFSFDGVEFYGVPVVPIEEALKKYNDCIPIINYDDDDEIDRDGNKHADTLYVLSEDSKFLGERKTPIDLSNFPLKYKENIKKDNFNLYIFNDSNRAEFVVQEIEIFNKRFNTNIECKIYSYSDNIDLVIKDLEEDKGVKKLLFLSGESDDLNNQDADIFVALLELKLRSKCLEDTEIFAEVVNPNNLSSLQNLGVVSIIVSNKIISLFMIQLLTQPNARKFYRDIIVANDADNNEGSVDFDIVYANQLLDFDSTLKFGCYSELVQSFYKASNSRKMLLGIKPKGQEEITFLCRKMDEQKDVLLNPDDELIVISY